ncbi:MFS transporter [Roseospira marina]|uniref:MFS transporter n=1 Tax=Roseospira marina TaxID=140057 RepID=A0A5M6IG60_9PROT|nr:MFS transporter [Roseospira marina]KAA5606665.1 MFS transporter [Roseospira marina]MBB4313925.1 MFS family permease [Roseospira marina]MBB5087087.1 MFS family permease [Roseospira marina]
MSTTASHAHVIRRPQDVVDLVNTHPAIRSGLGITLIALGGILIDAYQAAMIGFGNRYIAQEFGISPGLAATVNASVLIAALFGGLMANRVVERFGQRTAFVIGMGMCTVGAAAVAFAPNVLALLLCRIIMGIGLGIDFPLATSAVAELRGSSSKKTGTSVNLWQMGWYLSTTVVYLILVPLAASSVAEPDLWRYGIFIGAGFAVVVMILRWVYLGESAMWAARKNRFDQSCRILKTRYGVDAQTASDAVAGTEGATDQVKGAYRILLSGRYRRRTILGCVVATMQAWQYNAVGVYLPLTLAGILTGGLTSALWGSAAVNLLCGVTGGAIGSLIVQRVGARRQSMIGFGFVVAALLILGLVGRDNPWLALGLLGSIIFFHSSGPGGLGMTIATMSYPPSIRPAGVGFARAIMRTGAIAGLIFWPMLWQALGTDAFFWLMAVPLVGFLTCALIPWEPIGADVDAEDADVLAQISKG